MTAHDRQPDATDAKPAPAAPSEVPPGLPVSLRQWLAAAVASGLVLALGPAGWKHAEAFDPGPDYRVPYALSEDYWLFDRYSRQAARRGEVLVVGDSVIWGHYVEPGQTLAARLNARAGGARFANLGLDGLYPLAMETLLRRHGRGITGCRVLLHLNPLWSASRQHDLQTGDARINHPLLLPQRPGSVPAYQVGPSQRLAAAAEGRLPFRTWARHLRLGHFDGSDLPAWTIQRPYACPVAGLLAPLPAPEDRPASEPPTPGPGGRTPRGGDMQDFEWLAPAESLQFGAFCRCLEVLRGRSNEVFVLVGPFNEHILRPGARATFTRRKAEMLAWLDGRGVPYFASEALPAALYADASHPVAAGYDRLAEELLRDEAFARWLNEGKSGTGGRTARR